VRRENVSEREQKESGFVAVFVSNGGLRRRE